MSSLHVFVGKTCFQIKLSWRVLNFFCQIFGILNSFSKLYSKNFADSLYDYDYIGVNDEESSDEEEDAIVTETDHSKPVSHTAADQSKLVSYTDSGSEEEDLHVDVNFDKPIDLTIN